MGKDAAFQILAKRLAHIGLWRVVVALAVELAGAVERVPSLEVVVYGLVQQRAVGVAQVGEFVELGCGAGWPARVRMRVRWAGGGQLLN